MPAGLETVEFGVPADRYLDRRRSVARFMEGYCLRSNFRIGDHPTGTQKTYNIWAQ
jgi:hypothetical protein